MYLVAIGWIYVVVMMAAAELASPSGTVLGAVMTLLLYGVLPLALLLYIMAAPMRSKAIRQRERSETAAEPTVGPASAPGNAAIQNSALDHPDSRSHAPGDPIAPVGKEP